MGPLKPYLMETCPAARLISADGMKNGLMRRAHTPGLLGGAGAWLQPIETRVIMLSSGIRAPLAVKLIEGKGQGRTAVEADGLVRFDHDNVLLSALAADRPAGVRLAVDCPTGVEALLGIVSGGVAQRDDGGLAAAWSAKTVRQAEKGYGLWLDPAVQDDPVYAEHWAGHRPVEITIEEDQIVIKRIDVE